MTSLEIQLLLNLYCRAFPHEGYPLQERVSPAMREAFTKFHRLDILADGVSFNSVMVRYEGSTQFLSAKGMLLVERLMEVKP